MRIIVFSGWLFAYCRQFTLYYQFPFAVQTYAFLRSIWRHSHFVRNHTKTVTSKYNITHLSWYFFKLVCFCSVSFALQKRRYLQWFRALEENHTICNNLSCLGGLLAGCCVDGVGWLGWVGWVELAGFAGGLFGCLTTCSTFCMAVFLSGAALIRQSLHCSALDSHRFPETCLSPNQALSQPIWQAMFVYDLSSAVTSVFM